MEISLLKVPQWEQYDGLLHGFTTRRGGKSSGPYAGLNLSYRVGDDIKVVSQNVCDMKLAVGIHDGKVVTMQQVHGDAIIEVKDRNLKEAGEADGMVTPEDGLYLGVLTADCVPLLLIAPKRRIAAAVHAGWRGTASGIAAKAVQFIQERYGVAAGDIEAALGPAIGACCYEVKEDVTQPLRERFAAMAESCIEQRDGRSYVDLRCLNRAMLNSAGVRSEKIFTVGPCTSCARDDFYSYRRERSETGRQMSVVGWLSS